MLAPLLLGACAARAEPPAWTPDEVRLVQWHGPWPPRRRAAPPPALVGLGERLFYDPRLSGNGSLLCASCHVPYRAFQDGRPLARGLAQAERNTPSLLNVGFFRRYGWDGGRASLAAQSLRPLLEPREMGSSKAHVAAVLRSYYGASGSDAELFELAGRALAAFQRTLVSGRTPFDEFRDSLAGADIAAPAYPEAAQRGLKHFIHRCSSCHAGPLFTSGAIARGLRVPTLRNVAATAPYMHDGSVASLEQAVRHDEATLGAAQVAELVEFLKTLSAAP
ncbi:MAG TPA: cytochrome-c peroxidase [Burkholderiales bacterium]